MSQVPVKGTETLEQRVARLLARWRDETAYLSSSTRLTGHPAYLELIALGPTALPFLFLPGTQAVYCVPGDLAALRVPPGSDPGRGVERTTR